MRRVGDAGETLVEIVMAIVLLGGLVAMLVTTIGTEARASTARRDLAAADTLLRSFAEATKQAVRHDCTRPDGTQSFTVSYTPPTPYATLTASGMCPAANDTRAVTLRITQPIKESMTIVVRTS